MGPASYDDSGKDTARADFKAPFERGGHFVRERGVRGSCLLLGDLLHERARSAPGLPQRPHEHRRAAGPALVEVSGPVVRRLTVGADKHLLILDHAAFPRTRAFARIGLSCAAAITGHERRTPRP